MRWCALLLSCCALILSACVQHSVELKPREARAAVRAYAERGAVDVAYGSQTLTLEREHEPSLRVQESVLFGEIDEAALGDVKVEGDDLVFPSREGPRRVDPDESYDIRLNMGQYHPPDEELLLGVGVAVGAPTVYSAPFFDIRFTDVIALEAGAFAVTKAVWGHAGLRLVPLEHGRLRPFFGGFIHGASFAQEDDDAPASYPPPKEEPRRLGALGPRLGVDWVLDSGHYAIRTEVDLVYNLRDRWLFGIESRWIPWGGVSAIAYQ